MTKQGIVIATDGVMATVQYSVKSKCDTCKKRTKIGACDSCPDYSDRAAVRIVAYNRIGAEVGDTVEYGRAPSENMIFALLVFAFPIVCAVISYFISVLFIDDNAAKSRVALIVFGIATAFACAYSYKHSKKRCDYSINRVVETED